MTVTFHQAFESAVRKYSPEMWPALSQSCQVAAIYDEMRRMDAEAAQLEEADQPTTVGQDVGSGQGYAGG
jgi:hypothetical protein